MGGGGKPEFSWYLIPQSSLLHQVSRTNSFASSSDSSVFPLVGDPFEK